MSICKHLNRKLLLWVLLAVLTGCFQRNASAQQPASFLLGEEQFRGIQIYDVIQDKSLNYWFATNEGIYHFNGVVYERVECNKAKSNSAFNFVMDEKGTIYCHNLNYQIFQIRNKQIRLFYELKEKEGSADISLIIDADGNLMVGSRQVITIAPNGRVLHRKVVSTHYIGPSYKTTTGSICYHLNNSDSILVYKDHQYSYNKLMLAGKPYRKDGVFRFIRHGKEEFAFDLATKKLYTFNSTSFKLELLPENAPMNTLLDARIYTTSHGFWVAATLPGIRFYGHNNRSDVAPFFPSYYISDVFEDAEGNLLLSTFDKGILVIPDIKIPDVLFTFPEDPVVAFHTSSSGLLLLGTSQGKLLGYTNGVLTTLRNSGNRPIEVINSSPSGKWYVFDDGYIRAHNTRTGKTLDMYEASLKDIAFVTDEAVYLGTNIGVFLVQESSETFQVTSIVPLKSRVHYLEYDEAHQLLYVASAVGVRTLDKHGKVQHLRYRGKELFPNNLLVHNGLLYLNSKEDGLLIFRNGRFVRRIIPMINDKQITIKKLLIYRNTFIANTADGFYQFNSKGKLLRSIGSEYGFSSNRVVDFVFCRGKLWVSHAGGVQQINLEYKSAKRPSTIVRIDKILVNDRQAQLPLKGSFSSDQRKFQFFFSTSTLRNRETVKYHYRLLGYETKWNTGDFDARQVAYSALAPGTYTFQIRMENQGNYSKMRVVSFTIVPPLYMRWWFLLLSGLVLTGLIVYTYRWQLSVQRRKAERINELNASKLTAIQSQMNPHFIFNSLNSIQDLILKGDVEHSYSYITTFSNLVRRTLNYSEKDFIAFDQELKLLELYLSLEKLRFKKDFDYAIHTDELEEDVMIPPLLIQPFVENALVHGLLHKEGEKRLSVSFHLEDVLICVIEDNGIGREAARAIRQRQRADHESFSGKAILRRFEILGSVFGGQFGYSYEDLSNNGVPSGTRVTLRIPVKNQF